MSANNYKPTNDYPFYLPGITAAGSKVELSNFGTKNSIFRLFRHAVLGNIERPYEQEIAGYYDVRNRGMTRQKNQTDMDLVFPIVKAFKEGNWSLFLDDSRTPHGAGAYQTTDCLIARTNRAAVYLTERLGVPKTIYLDYKLRGETTQDYLLWLYSYMAAKGIAFNVKPAFVVNYLCKADEAQILMDYQRDIQSGLIALKDTDLLKQSFDLPHVTSKPSPQPA